MPRNYTQRDEDRLRFARLEYQELGGAVRARYLLSAAFDHGEFRIAEYCRDFTANLYAIAVESEVRAWAKRFDLWIPGVTEQCNDLASYVYPNVNPGRLATLSKHYVVGWYLNDTIGREFIANLASKDQIFADHLRARVIQTVKTLTLEPDAAPIEYACVDVLKAIEADSTPEWFASFLSLWIGNLETMCRDWNARSLDVVTTVPEYITTRNYVAGMHHMIALSEFAQNQYLDWSELRRHGLVEAVERFWWLYAVIGSLSNDLFSFEKEFVCNGSDSNVVLISILNDPALTLHEAIVATITLVRNHVAEFIELARFLVTRCDELATLGHALPPIPLRAFVQSLEWSLKATWVWQSRSLRYKSPASIFLETRLGEAKCAATTPQEVGSFCDMKGGYFHPPQ